MCDCVDHILDQMICEHNTMTLNIFKNFNYDSLPVIPGANFVKYMEEVKRNNNINLLAKIPTSVSRDIFYGDRNHNIFGDYIILIAYEDTLYKVYPNDVLEKILCLNNLK